MNQSLEHRLKAKLRTLSQESGQSPMDLWTVLALERLLVRLSRSSYDSHFTLKGGLLLSKYLPIQRYTRDLDFSVKGLSMDHQVVASAFEQITTIDLGDGFSFDSLEVQSLDHPHMDYSGARVNGTAHFGRTRIKIAVDLGVGDCAPAILSDLNLLASSKGASD